LEKICSEVALLSQVPKSHNPKDNMALMAGQ